jgi:glycosyltransferase involved in cell wall biosynthesis
MGVSVIIPAYNCEATIRETVNSVLRQTVQPEEILVLNDGSTDGTASVLRHYETRLTVRSQRNQGVASALNSLCKSARGDLVAVLGSDDIWHARYLEVQCSLFEEYPHAVAYFTGHVNFAGNADYTWSSDPFDQNANIEIIQPLQFLQRYNAAPGPFMCMSHCCVPKRVLTELGDEPFKLRMAEDLYFFNLVAPSGPVVFLPKPMAAYRVREGSLSSDRLKLTEAEVRAFELLDKRYEAVADASLIRAFRRSFAAKRRQHAKVLLGAGLTSPARDQIRRSLGSTLNLFSLAKSLRLLLLSYLPKPLQPTWPPVHREWKDSQDS